LPYGYQDNTVLHMARKPPVPKNADNAEQSRRFIDAAQKAEADEKPGATDRAFERVIRPRPTQEKTGCKSSSSES
jgi:hypothetical protein